MAVAAALVSVGVTAGTLGILAGIVDGTRPVRTDLDRECQNLADLTGVTPADLKAAVREYLQEATPDTARACLAQLRQQLEPRAVDGSLVPGGQDPNVDDDDDDGRSVGSVEPSSGSEDSTVGGAESARTDETGPGPGPGPRAPDNPGSLDEGGSDEASANPNEDEDAEPAAEGSVPETEEQPPVPETEEQPPVPETEEQPPAPETEKRPAPAQGAQERTPPDMPLTTVSAEGGARRTNGFDVVSDAGTPSAAPSDPTWLSAGTSDASDNDSVASSWSAFMSAGADRDI